MVQAKARHRAQDTFFFLHVPDKTYAYIFDLEKKLGVLLTGEGRGGVSLLTANIC